MANLTSKIAVVKESDYESTPKLGHLVWMQAFSRVDKKWVDCKKIVEAHGLSYGKFRETSAKKAFALAVRKIRFTGRNSDNRIVVRPVKETPTAMRYQVTYEKVKGEKELEYSKQMVVAFNKETEEITFEGSNGALAPFRQSIQQNFERYRDRAYNRNLLKFATRLIYKSLGVAVRDRGGVWFVPDEYTKEIQALEKIFEEFEGVFYRHPVIDTQKWRNNVSTMVNDDLDFDLDKLEEDLDTLLVVAKKDGTIKSKTLKTRLARFQEVQKKATAYEKLLHYRAGDVKKKLEDSTRKIQAILTGKTAGIKVQLTRKEIKASR